MSSKVIFCVNNWNQGTLQGTRVLLAAAGFCLILRNTLPRCGWERADMWPLRPPLYAKTWSLEVVEAAIIEYIEKRL